MPTGPSTLALTGDSSVPSDPTQTLGYLSGTGHVTVVGEATIDGQPTTRYHAVVDFDRVLAVAPPADRATVRGQVQTVERLTGARTLPIDVWVDKDRLVRRMSFAMRVCAPDGPVQVDVTLDLLRFGPSPVVHIPAPSQVTDVSSQAQASQAQAESLAHC